MTTSGHSKAPPTSTEPLTTIPTLSGTTTDISTTSGTPTPTTESPCDGCWSEWIDTWKPSPTNGGDFEILEKITIDYPVCRMPYEIECREKNFKTPYQSTGQRVTCKTNEGLMCLNSDNFGVCYNYEIRLCCPCNLTTIPPTTSTVQPTTTLTVTTTEEPTTTLTSTVQPTTTLTVTTTEEPTTTLMSTVQPTTTPTFTTTEEPTTTLTSTVQPTTTPTIITSKEPTTTLTSTVQPTTTPTITTTEEPTTTLTSTVQPTTTPTVATTEIKTTTLTTTEGPREPFKCEFDCDFFNSFDGNSFYFKVCDDIITKTVGDVDPFEVIVRRPLGDRNSCCLCDFELEVNMDRYSIVVYTVDSHVLSVNSIPVSLGQLQAFSQTIKAESGMTIKKTGKTVVIESDIGITIKWKDNRLLHIYVARELEGALNGLCSIPNDDPEDDVPPSTFQPACNCSDSECRNCSTIYPNLPNICDRLWDLEFSHCEQFVDISKYVDMCKENICDCVEKAYMKNEDLVFDDVNNTCGCEIFENFIYECNNHPENPTCFEWRTPERCPGNVCPIGQIWKECGSTCEWTCDVFGNEVEDCKTGTSPGCYCPPGKVKLGDECVDREECKDCTCVGYGDPHYYTFDMFYYPFQGECTYVLSRDSSSNRDYEIYASNEICINAPTTTCTYEMTVFYNNHSVAVTRERKISVDGDDWIIVPPKYTGYGFVVEPKGVFQIYVSIPAINLELMYDYISDSFILTVPSSRYFNQTEGLCGICNKDPSDDLTMPNGTITNNTDEFGFSWLVDRNCNNSTNETCTVGDEQPEICDVLYRPPFLNCSIFVETGPFYNACVFDTVCGEGPCDTLDTYARLCNEKGGLCIEWREEVDICPYPECDELMEYKACHEGCQVLGCDEWLERGGEQFTCKKVELDGCYCPDGLIMNSTGHCISPEICLQPTTTPTVTTSEGPTTTLTSTVQPTTTPTIITSKEPTTTLTSTVQPTTTLTVTTTEEPTTTLMSTVQPTTTPTITTTEGPTTTLMSTVQPTTTLTIITSKEPTTTLTSTVQPTTTPTITTTEEPTTTLTSTVQPTTTPTVATTEIKTTTLTTTEGPREPFTCEFDCDFFNSFDGNSFYFKVCDDIITKTVGDVDPFEVIVRRLLGDRDSCCLCDFELEVNMDRYSIVVYTVDSHVLSVNSTPVSLGQLQAFSQTLKAESGMTIKMTGKTVVMESDIGITIKWKDNRLLHINVARELEGALNGLCGIPNDDPEDDVPPSIFQPACNCSNSECSNCSTIYPNLPNICDSLWEPVFSRCEQFVNISKYVDMCEEHICDCVEKAYMKDEDLVFDDITNTCACEIFENFMYECNNHPENPTCFEWRTPELCSGNVCPIDQIWKECGSTCEWTCDERGNQVEDCNTGSSPGCYCPSDKVKLGDECVDREECKDCTCVGYGDPHYYTFDMFYYPFQGECTYVLSRDSSSNRDYEIYASNEICINAPNTTCTYEMTVFYNNHSVAVTRERKISVDGDNWIIVPPKYTGYGFVVEPKGVFQIYVSIPAINLELMYDYISDSFILTVPSSRYFNQTEGLCGICNKDSSDDLTMPNGTLTNNTDEFGFSWLVDRNCTNPTSKTCTVGDEQPEICDVLYRPPFSNCSIFVETSPFYNACVFDTVCGGGPCDTLDTYARLCNEQGGLCIEWREEVDICPYPECDELMEYKACHEGCQVLGCDEWLERGGEQVTCTKLELDGCYCPDGLIMNSTGHCISPEICSFCEYDGKKYETDDSWRINECETGRCVNRTVVISTTVCPTPPSCQSDERLVSTVVDGDCCLEYECVCNCAATITPTCPFGYEESITLSETHCGCPLATCVPREVCLYNSTIIFEPGEAIEVDYCTTCTCLEDSPVPGNFYRYDCNTLGCSNCSEGYVSVPKEGVCCGECKQKYCIDPEGNYKSTGDTWSPTPCDTCTCVENGDEVKESCVTTACPPFNESACIEPGSVIKLDPSGCCHICGEFLHGITTILLCSYMSNE
ncbi:mucin-5B-like [Anneissia japonica]|uniref:mucin-5B-like n=1 Tax=Anneissia japonica TaxID=1529436 RepID=UPI001425BAF1|nr:mucin-5B-like [Anneissia japonica]